MASISEIPVITIDGPGGSGKGTIGLSVAKQLGWHFLDSGALYRILALAAIKHKVDLKNEAALLSLALALDIRFNTDIFLEDQCVTDLIREEHCGNVASEIAIFPGVRAALLEKQRAFCQLPGLVADGRDMGTVVFPNARLKIFLEASVEARAKRRYFQLKNKGQNVSLNNLLLEMRERDERDRGRVAAPLKPAKDALVIDTTGMGVEVVFDTVMKAVKQRFY